METILDEGEPTTGSSDSEPNRPAVGNNPFARIGGSISPVVNMDLFSSMTIEQLQRLVDNKARKEESALRKIAEDLTRRNELLRLLGVSNQSVGKVDR